MEQVKAHPLVTQAKNYLLGQLDKMTAWIGFIGLVLLFLGFTGILALLFIALVVLPETQFSSLFKGWTVKLRDMDAK